MSTQRSGRVHELWKMRLPEDFVDTWADKTPERDRRTGDVDNTNTTQTATTTETESDSEWESASDSDSGSQSETKSEEDLKEEIFISPAHAEGSTSTRPRAIRASLPGMEKTIRSRIPVPKSGLGTNKEPPPPSPEQQQPAPLSKEQQYDNAEIPDDEKGIDKEDQLDTLTTILQRSTPETTKVKYPSLIEELKYHHAVLPEYCTSTVPRPTIRDAGNSRSYIWKGGRVGWELGPGKSPLGETTKSSTTSDA